MFPGSRRDRLWSRVFGRQATTIKQRRRALLEPLENRHVMAGFPIISEFMAANSEGIRDADGDQSDWIEIYNPTADPINLQGWSLTDDPGDLNEWVFPAVTIEPNSFLTVFASDKNRTTGPELHTNFKLSAGGDYLALVNPSSVVVSEYAPAYPAQLDNVSYGVAFDTAQLVQPGAAAQVRVPSDGSLGSTWTTPGFNPVGWTTGTTGIGFGVVHPGFNIVYARANVEVSDLNVARAVITTPSMRSLTLNTTAAVVNYMGTGGGGRYGGDSAFPNQSIGDDINDFVVQANGVVKIPTAGQWTFAVNSDDGFELKLERSGVTFASEFFNPRGASDTFATFNIPTAGDWNISALMYERAGGASFELFAAPGSFGSFNAAAFDLVGDTANGGLATYAPIGVGTGVVVGTDTRAAMQNVNATAYVRIPFNVVNPSAYDALQLNMQYDDGFVAYLNGVEVARRNAPASLAFNSAATTDRSLTEATTAESINLTSFLGSLQVGANVLAIQGLNSSAGDDSFLVLPQLVASKVHLDQLRYFHTSTPSTFNVNPALGVIDRVSANVPAGFYNNPISVTLSTPSAGATIRYTVDGSTPTPTNGLIYTGPVAVSSTTTLRAGAFRTDYLSMPTITRSYIFLDDVIRQSPSDDVPGAPYPDVGAPPVGWPASWGSNVVDYGMDQTIVNQAGAEAVKSALLAISTISIATDLSNLFDPTTGIYANARQDGRDWERPASVELLNPDGSAGFQVNAGIRIRGGFSRSPDNPKHAFRVFLRGEYGDSSLEYPLFGTEGADSFKKFDLRTAQNYSWSFGGDASNTMIQDGFARQSQLDMGQPGSHSRWVHLYLDGQYWGIFQIEERPEAEFAATYFGGSADDYDVVKPEAGPYTINATDGNLDAYQRLWQFVTTQDLANNANYFRIQGKNALGVDDASIPSEDVLLDVDNLVVYMLGILHGGNLDAPISNFLSNQGVNNFFAIRDRTGREGFKYIQHDAEHSLRNLNENRNGPYPAGQTFDRFNPQFLHQQLMVNAEYRLRFADLVQQNFFNGGPMSAEVAGARFQKDVALLDPAIVAESARWGDSKRPTSPLGKSNWLPAVANMAGFVANRNPILISQFQANGLFPTVGAAQFLINGVPQNSGQILPGSVLRMAASTGLVYYTTDGSDPRLVGGGINPTALPYDPSGTDSTLVATGSQWKYFDQGTDLGTGWRAESFNDSAWAAGNAELGYGDSDEATVVGFGPNSNAKHITTYFRKSFAVASVSDLTGLKLRLKRDDGAVVYINGVEATRSNMPTGTILSSTLASSNIGGADEQTFYEFDLNPGLLHVGTNVIAVEIHQSTGNSTDISFDASLVARIQTNPGLPLLSSTNLQARVLNGGNWSPLTDANFSTATKAAAGNLAVTEVHYNPAAMAGTLPPPFDDKQNFEFIELRNTSTSTIDLTGVQFVTGITFNFTGSAVTFLAPGQHVVVVKDRLAFETRYGTGVLVAGVYSGNLDNGGEQLRLVSSTGATIQDFVYDDNPSTSPPWVTSPDGDGPSLTVLSVTGNYSLGSNWRASYLTHGTPGYEENDYPANLAMTGGSVAENLADAVAGTLSASDPNVGDVLTYSLVNNPGGTFALVGANVVLAPGVLLDYETQSSYSITVRVTDAGGLFIERAFTILVTDVAEANVAPTFVAGAGPVVNEDSGAQSVAGFASGFVPGPANESAQTVLAYLVQGVSNPSLFAVPPAVATNGTLTYTLATNAFGSSTFELRVRDSGGTENGGVDTSAPQIVTITVNPVNDVPSFAKGPDVTVPYNAPAQSLPTWASAISIGPANETGQQPSFTIASNSLPSLFAGPITISPTGTLNFTPAAGMSGTATIGVAIHDDGGTANGGVDTSATQTFTITVSPAPVNALPTIGAIGNLTILEGAGLQTIAFGGVTDGGDSPAQAVIVTAVSTNSTLVPIVVNYTAPSATGTLTFTPPVNDNGSSSVTVTVRDSGLDLIPGNGDDGIVTTTFTVTVTAVNDQPSFTAANPPTVNEDAGLQTVGGFVTSFSPGPSNESSQGVSNYLVSNVSNPGLFAVLPAVSATGALTYTLAANANGGSTFDVRVVDNGGTSNGGIDTSVAQTFTITVNPVNDAPSFNVGLNQVVANTAPLQTVTNWATAISAGPANESGQTVSFNVTGNTNAGLFSTLPTVASNGTLTYAPAPGAAGTATITLVAQDNGGGADTSAPLSFTITVLDNHAPTINSIGNLTLNENAGPQVVNLAGITAGGETQTLTVTAASNNPALVPNPTVTYASPASTGTLSFASLPNQFGVATITVTVRDAGFDGLLNTSDDALTTTSFTITINEVNDPPVGNDSTISAMFNTPASGTLSATDPDGPTLTFAIVMNPVLGTLTAFNPNTGAFTYTPTPGATGLDLFSFSVTDGTNSDTGIVRVTIQGAQPAVTVNGGDLLVIGTPGPDMIIVSHVSAGRVQVRTERASAAYPLSGQLIVNAGQGDDYVVATGVQVPTTLDLGEGDDYGSSGMQDDLIIGGAGNDQINASGGDNVIWGDNVGEQDLAAGGNDRLSSLGGNDVMYGGGGNDQLFPGAGNDYVNAGQGDDLVSGGAGNDRIFGGLGNDGLYGDEGDDILVGGSGNDTLVGRIGNDILIGGLGADSINGNEGNDLLIGGNTTNSGSSTAGDANDLALLAMLASWNASRPLGLATPVLAGNDGAIDSLSGYTGDDDFYLNAGDLSSDFNGNGMGSDRIINS